MQALFRRMFAAIPVAAFIYVIMGQEVLERVFPDIPNTKHIVWPILFLLTLMLAVACWRDLDLKRLVRAPVLVLGLFLSFAGASVLWAYSPTDTFNRWVLSAIIVATIILPMTLKQPEFDFVKALFWSYAAALFINGIFVLATPPMMSWQGEVLGHAGYFLHKQYLGMCGSMAFLIATYMFFSGQKRSVALLIIVASLWIVWESSSKTSLGFAILAPAAAAAALFASRKTKVSLVWIVFAVPAFYILLGNFIPNLSERLSYRIYGDSTFTGRIFIWNFVEQHAALRPWLGWGFHSYWAVPNSPSQLATGFVKDMPAAHSGYLDTRLELGYIGLLLFLAFLAASIYSLERVRRQDPGRAMLFLSVIIYIMLMNLLETIWLVPFDPLWTSFLLVTAEAVRQGSATLTKPVAMVTAEPQKVRVHRFPHATVGVFNPNRHIHL